jgi:peroxiredoxin
MAAKLLKTQLEALRHDVEANADPALLTAMRRSLCKLRESGIVARATKAGDMAPLFRLSARRGTFVTLSDLLSHGPAVVSFFRGDWCPFCALELQALADVYPEIERLGAALVALSPYASDKLSSPGERAKLPFRILKDPVCRVASLYGLAFSVSEHLEATGFALGSPRPPSNQGWLLPIPATYVVDATGRVVLSYLDADYTTRLEPKEIIVLLAGLRESRGSLPFVGRRDSADPYRFRNEK